MVPLRAVCRLLSGSERLALARVTERICCDFDPVRTSSFHGSESELVVIAEGTGRVGLRSENRDAVGDRSALGTRLIAGSLAMTFKPARWVFGVEPLVAAATGTRAIAAVAAAIRMPSELLACTVSIMRRSS